MTALPILAIFQTFDYAGLRNACHTLNDYLMPVAFVMTVLGLVQAMSNGSQDIEQKMMSLVLFVVLVGGVSFWYPRNGPSLVQGMYDIAGEAEGKVNGPTRGDIETGLLELVGGEAAYSYLKDQQENPRETGRTWSEYLQQFIGFSGLLTSRIAEVIFNASFMIVGGVGPLFFGFLMFQQTRQVGITFILSTIALTLWPVGWAFCRFGSDLLLNMGQNALALNLGAILLGQNDPFAADTALGWSALLSAWILTYTAGIPILLQTLVTYGASTFGGQFAGSAQAMPMGGTGRAAGGGASVPQPVMQSHAAPAGGSRAAVPQSTPS